MNVDQYGQAHVSAKQLADLLYANPDLDIAQFQVDDPEQYNRSRAELHAELPELVKYTEQTCDLEEFDRGHQQCWYMPASYRELDIARWVLDQCSNDTELQRSGHELLLYQERNLFDLLRYLKYLVDTMREHGVVWGVGRGSSVASFVLYLIGVHRINSIYYDLDIQEFLK